MSRFNSVPVNIQQMVESVKSKSTPANVKFNQVQVLEAVRDYCNQALDHYNKTR